MKNFYRIKITQANSLLNYFPEANNVNLGFFNKPKKDVEKYASMIRKLLETGVKVEVIKHEIKII